MDINHISNTNIKNIIRDFNKNNTKFNIIIKNKNKNIDFGIVPIGKKNIFEEHCIWFSINKLEKKLYNIFLNRCSLLSGPEILDILEKIAKKFNLSEIHLIDASHISIISLTNKIYSISLTNMYILSEGISWYNKYGYISKSFNEEKDYNKIIMELPLSEFMKLILINQKMNLNISNSFFDIVKNEFNRNNLKIFLLKRKNSIKKIIKEKYGINNRKDITDAILLESIKIYYKYDEKIEEINSIHRKFIAYINSLNLHNYIKNSSKISDIINNFRKKLKNKNIRFDDSEIEFIEYILQRTNNILKYDANLVKVIDSDNNLL